MGGRQFRALAALAFLAATPLAADTHTGTATDNDISGSSVDGAQGQPLNLFPSNRQPASQVISVRRSASSTAPLSWLGDRRAATNTLPTALGNTTKTATTLTAGPRTGPDLLASAQIPKTSLTGLTLTHAPGTGTEGTAKLYNAVVVPGQGGNLSAFFGLTPGKFELISGGGAGAPPGGNNGGGGGGTGTGKGNDSKNGEEQQPPQQLPPIPPGMAGGPAGTPGGAPLTRAQQLGIESALSNALTRTTSLGGLNLPLETAERRIATLRAGPNPYGAMQTLTATLDAVTGLPAADRTRMLTMVGGILNPPGPTAVVTGNEMRNVMFLGAAIRNMNSGPGTGLTGAALGEMAHTILNRGPEAFGLGITRLLENPTHMATVTATRPPGFSLDSLWNPGPNTEANWAYVRAVLGGGTAPLPAAFWTAGIPRPTPS